MTIYEGMWGGRDRKSFVIDFKTASEDDISLWFRHFKPPRPADGVMRGNGLLSPGDKVHHNLRPVTTSSCNLRLNRASSQIIEPQLAVSGTS